MEIGVYLCLIAPFWLGGLALLRQGGARFFVYAIVALLVPEFSLVAFYALSYWAGLNCLGRPCSWSYPSDYLARGFIGWLVCLIPLVGLLSPLLIGWLLRQRLPRTNAAQI